MNVHESRLRSMIEPGRSPWDKSDPRRKAIEWALESRDELLAMLRRLQWLGLKFSPYEDTCPLCWGIDPEEDGSGHKPDCPLGVLLASTPSPAGPPDNAGGQRP